MMLSADAAPFHPVSEAVDFGIFNDGVPSLYVPGGSVSSVLHGIQDTALDEHFPLSADDAEELDLIEFYVAALATLSLMEDMEEKARTNFGHIKKRWEARREEGLKHRPRPAGDHDMLLHQHGHKASTSNTIVPMEHIGRHLSKTRFDSESTKLRAKEMRHLSKSALNQKVGARQPKLLQQPRKHY